MPSGSFSPYGGELHALVLYMDQHKQMEGKSWAAFLAKYFKEVYPGKAQMTNPGHATVTLRVHFEEGRRWQS